jgi:hypothetical protein
MEKEFQILNQIKKVEVPPKLFENIKIKIKEREICEKYLPFSWAAAAILIIISINAFAISNINKSNKKSTASVYSSFIKLNMYD